MDSPSTPPRPLGRDAVDVLAEIPLFSGLSRRHIAKVGSCASTKRFAAGAPLVRVGEPAATFFVILDGQVRVEIPRRPVTLGIGEFFGEMALIDGEPRSATVVAIGEVYALMLPRTKFLKVLAAEPKIALAILATLTGRLRALQAATA